jgi:hypothetical protein
MSYLWSNLAQLIWGVTTSRMTGNQLTKDLGILLFTSYCSYWQVHTEFATSPCHPRWNSSRSQSGRSRKIIYSIWCPG